MVRRASGEGRLSGATAVSAPQLRGWSPCRRPSRHGRSQRRGFPACSVRRAWRPPLSTHPRTRSSRRTTCGCTSPGWAGTRPPTCRSSCAATGATSRTRTGSATSTRSPASSRSTSATATARRSGRRRSSRCASCPSTRTGRTPIRARSSSPPRSPRSRPATSTACSSSRAARRRSSRPGSSRASTTSRGARSACARCSPSPRPTTTPSSPRRSHGRGATRRSRGTSPTTGRRMGALSINGIPAIRAPFEPLVPEVRHVHNTNRYHRPARGDGGGVHRLPARRSRADDRGDGPRDGVPRAHGAGAERRRLLHAACGLLAGRAGDLRPLRHPALGRRGDHGLRAPRALVRLRALRHPTRTSSRARRASRPRTRRSAP